MVLRFAMSLCLASILFAADQQTSGKDKQHSWPRVRFGGFTVNAGYSRYSGGYYPWFYPGWYGYPAAWGYGPMWYNPFFWGAIHPGFYTGFAYQPNLGEVKMQGIDRGSWVYIDGALAGRVEKLKTMWLEPGAYTIEVRPAQSAQGRSRKVYVLSGKTLKVTPEIMEAR